VPEHGPAVALTSPPGPNPAGLTGVVSFSLPLPTDARVEIFDIAGRRVARLLDGPRSAGTHTVEWDLTDDSGRAVASGVYLWRIEAGGSVLTARQVVLR
jgi:flagellar hook assembly protein FlgD